jgi:hypothetical protein
MYNDLQFIQQKVRDIQFGLLQMRDKDKKESWQVRATTNDDNSLNCIIKDISLRKKFMNRNVNLIQKYKDDYLFITGKVSNEVNNGSRILSLHILKACWFVRKSKGSVSWLQEKYMYENLGMQEIGKLAS